MVLTSVLRAIHTSRAAGVLLGIRSFLGSKVAMALPGSSISNPVDSCTTEKDLQHQVFVNHAGPDGGEFAAAVNEKLQNKGIKTFIDYESLPFGEEWRPNIRENASGSKIFVAVLTPKYLDRGDGAKKPFWPMHELDLAMQVSKEREEKGLGGIKFLPVYKGITVEDIGKSLENWKSNWEEMKSKHMNKETGQSDIDPDRWAQNLKDLEGIQGAIHSGGKATIIDLQDRVVQFVLKHLHLKLDVPTNIFGVERPFQDICEKLQSGGCIGLYGIGMFQFFIHLCCA
jgi:hypothetical protein